MPKEANCSMQFDHFLVSLSVPSLNILYFSLAFSVSTLILASISLELSSNFSLAPLNSLMVESLSFLRNLRECGCTRGRGGRRWSDFLPCVRVASWSARSFLWFCWAVRASFHRFWPVRQRCASPSRFTSAKWEKGYLVVKWLLLLWDVDHSIK